MTERSLWLRPGKRIGAYKSLPILTFGLPRSRRSSSLLLIGKAWFRAAEPAVTFVLSGGYPMKWRVGRLPLCVSAQVSLEMSIHAGRSRPQKEPYFLLAMPYPAGYVHPSCSLTKLTRCGQLGDLA